LASSDWQTLAKPSPKHTTSSKQRFIATLVVKNWGHASDLMAIFQILAFFAYSVIVPSGSMKKEIASSLAWFATTEKLSDLRDNLTQAGCSEMLELQQLHMSLFVDRYGVEAAKPKHHYQFHIPQQAADLNMLLDCFATEWKRSLFKRHIARRFNSLGTFEKDVVASLIQHAVDSDDTPQSATIPVILND